MEGLLAASALYGLREDLRTFEPPCPVVTALVVHSLFGGRIFRYAQGLNGSDYVNEIQIGEGEFYRVDLTQFSIGYDRSAFATEECFSYDLLANPDTYVEYQEMVSGLLKYWQDHRD